MHTTGVPHFIIVRLFIPARQRRLDNMKNASLTHSKLSEFFMSCLWKSVLISLHNLHNFVSVCVFLPSFTCKIIIITQEVAMATNLVLLMAFAREIGDDDRSSSQRCRFSDLHFHFSEHIYRAHARHFHWKSLILICIMCLQQWTDTLGRKICVRFGLIKFYFKWLELVVGRGGTKKYEI